jgi:ATP-binding cassette, subfamily B, bacterial MsbA
MKDFLRVLRIAARQRLALASCVFTSLIIALLWGMNIGALYPLVEVVFKGDSLPSYFAEKIADSETKLKIQDQAIDDLRQEILRASADLRPTLEMDLRYKKLERDAIATSTSWMQWIKPTIDQYAPEKPYPTLLAIIGFLMIGTVVKLLALSANLLIVQVITERTTMAVRGIFFRRALQLDLDDFGDNGSSQLTSRLTNDVGHISNGINTLLGRMVREPLKMAVCVGGAAFVCWRLLVFVFVVMPIVAMITHNLSRAIRRASKRVMDEMSQMYGMLNEAFAGIRLVKASNTQAMERARFGRGLKTYYRRSMKMAIYNTAARGASEFLGTSVVCLAILAGGYLVVNQQTHLLGLRMSVRPLEVGEILLFFGFLIGASDPARKLAEVWSNLQRGMAASERLFEVIDRPVRVRNPLMAKQVARPHREIRFEGVHFRYPAGPPVLRGIDLTIEAGETIAVVGPNGCGKSTIVSLLCRFDDPQEGRVLFDDVALPDMRIRDVRRRIGLVTQRTTLFDDSIENNIRYGSRSASADDVIQAAKMAYADEFIRTKTPDGYDTVLGNRGTRLSGGQMQRVALARAFLRNPDILILDEATSQIDLESEHLIHQALAKFLVNRTGILITHRPTTLAMADRIIVMEAGKIADCGQHEELLHRNRFYQSLCGGGTSAKAA